MLARSLNLLRLEVACLLGRARKPLNPSAAELDQGIETLRNEGLVSGDHLNRDSIVAEMNCLH